jgi:hypothetical protein
MTVESLEHSPEFELPAYGKPAPADLITLVEENHQGLAKVTVQRMKQRNSYETICSIKTQENPSRTTYPSASPEEISEYVMLCIQYEIDRTDEYGKFKIIVYGPPGKGRWERSKHIEINDGDEPARATSVMSESDTLEMQKEYIGELHQQLVSMNETVTGLINPLLKENREMMKIVSDSQRKLAEIEMMRLNHELELRKINDEREQREMEAAQSQQKWNRVMDHLDEAGAAEAIMKGLAKVMKRFEGGADPESKEEDKKGESKNSENPDSNSNAAKKKKKKKKKSKGKVAAVPESSSESTAIEKVSEEDRLRQEFEQRMKKSPNMVRAEMLKDMISAKGQWQLVKDTLSEDQFAVFVGVMKAETEEQCIKRLKVLYNLKGAKKFFKLQQHLDEEQEELVNELLETAMS